MTMRRTLLILAAVIGFSASVFAQTAAPKGSKPVKQPKPSAPMGCKLVGTVKGTKLWGRRLCGTVRAPGHYCRTCRAGTGPRSKSPGSQRIVRPLCNRPAPPRRIGAHALFRSGLPTYQPPRKRILRAGRRQGFTVQWRMPELTRRRSPDARDECWHVYFGDVLVGTIAVRRACRITKTLGATGIRSDLPD